MNLGILGFGVASSTIASGLQGRGPVETRVWKRRPWSADVRLRADDMGVVLCADPREAVEPSDVIFSPVPPSTAVEVAERSAPGRAGKLYVDLDATAPGAMEDACKAVEGASGRFVDGAIMGPLGRQKHRVSTVVSGKEAEPLAATLRRWDMDVRAIGTRAGLASTVKMDRSVYTKGLEAIVLETIRAAHEYGAAELVLGSLEEILRLGPFLLRLRGMVNELVVE